MPESPRKSWRLHSKTPPLRSSLQSYHDTIPGRLARSGNSSRKGPRTYGRRLRARVAPPIARILLERSGLEAYKSSRGFTSKTTIGSTAGVGVPGKGDGEWQSA